MYCSASFFLNEGHTNRSNMNTLFHGFLIISWFRNCAGGFLVWGPSGPIVTQLRAAVLLPCSVDSPLPLQDLEVDWKKSDSETLVHLFQDGESRPESQHHSYRDRAQFLPQEIPKGNFSLLLMNVTTEDEGEYTCVVHTDLESNEVFMEVKVERLVVTGADQAVFVHVDEEVVLNCSVDTHSPLGELEVQWLKTDQSTLVLLFSEGESRPESQHERYMGRAEFFTEEIPKGNFSVKLKGVRTEDEGEFMCIVHTESDSANATVWVKTLGFSSLQIGVLFLSILGTVTAAAIGVPSLRFLYKQDVSKKALCFHFAQVLTPCIVISTAFILWGVSEGTIAVSVICGAVNLMRFLLLFCIAPYLYSFSEIWKFLFWGLGLRLETLVVYGCVFIVFLLESWSRQTAIVGIIFGIITGLSVVLAICFGSVAWFRLSEIWRFIFWVLSLAFENLCVPICVIIVTLLDIRIIPTETVVGLIIGLLVLLAILLGFAVLIWRRGYDAWIRWVGVFYFGFKAFSCVLVIGLFAFIHNYFKWDFFLILGACFGVVLCLFLKSRFYVFSLIFLFIAFILQLIFSFLYLNTALEKSKDRSTKMCAVAILYILAARSGFTDDNDLPVVPRNIVYTIGAVVLPVVNSIALATELILKTEKGEQTLDLPMITLSSESVFMIFWLLLQMHAYYSRKKAKIREEIGAIITQIGKLRQASGSSQQMENPPTAQELEVLSQQEHGSEDEGSPVQTEK